MSGTIPDGLRRLRKVMLINLANNWLNGTLPAWIADLAELRVLNLGSNQGGNEGRNVTSGGDDEEEMLGLLGSIPKGFSQLTKLRELNLEANSLTGELPQDLCQGGECYRISASSVCMQVAQPSSCTVACERFGSAHLSGSWMSCMLLPPCLLRY